jgi:hypothetical protein
LVALLSRGSRSVEEKRRVSLEALDDGCVSRILKAARSEPDGLDIRQIDGVTMK